MIHDLAAAAGLPVSLGVASDAPEWGAAPSDDETCRLLFAAPLAAIAPATRPADQLRQVYRDPAAVDRAASQGLYFMYDGVALPEHRAAIARAGLRYDLTLLRRATVGDEPVKTLGHYHDLAPDGLPYPELYQVVFGVAYFVLQLAHERLPLAPRRDNVTQSPPGLRSLGEVGSAVSLPCYQVQRVVVVEARAGDVVLMPPGWGHVSVNAGDTPLVMCNWIADACKAVAEPYLERRGAAWHAVRQQGRLSMSPNRAYRVVLPMVAKRATPRPPLALPRGPIYAQGSANLDDLRPLVEPASFNWPAEP